MQEKWSPAGGIVVNTLFNYAQLLKMRCKRLYVSIMKMIINTIQSYLSLYSASVLNLFFSFLIYIQLRMEIHIAQFIK